MSLIIQEVEDIQNQHYWKDVGYCNEEERELEEALSLCDLPLSKITSETKEDEAKEEENHILDNDFDFGSLVGSSNALDGEMCTADEVFSGGQILPYRNSVSSMSGLRSDSMDRRGFGSRSSSSRSSSIRSHYSGTSSSGSSCSSNNTNVSTKTVPMVSKAKVQNQFHSYPSPKPQILGSSMRFPTYASPVEKKSKMWEVLKLGLVRTPEIELRDLKSRTRTNNLGKTVTIPRNNSIGSSTSRNNNNNNNDRARKSCSNDGNIISDFMLEMQKRKNQLPEGNNSGFFRSCKCSVGAIEPIPCTTRPNYGGNFGSYYSKFGNNNQKNLTAKKEVLNEDKKLGLQKNRQLEVVEEQRHQQHRRNNNNIRQGTTQVMTSHHHHRRTFEWLKNLSHASILNDY